MQSVAANVQRGFETNDGVLPALLNDPEGKRRVYEIVENLRVTSTSLSSFMDSVQTGQGLLPRLLNDKAYGDQALAEFALLSKQLNEAVAKINNGEGTAGKLISDPSLYESVNDILIGINESKLLRWLIRNRQQAGIEKRYDEAQQAPAITPLPPAETMPRAQDPVAIPMTDTVAILPPPKTDTTTTEPPPPPNQ